MNPNFTPSPEKQALKLCDFSVEFLDDMREKLSDQEIKIALAKSEAESNTRMIEMSKEHAIKRNVSYDRFTESFSVKNEKDISMGTIVAARRLGLNIAVPELLDSFGEGKKLRAMMKNKILEDSIAVNLNNALAKILAEETKQKDLRKSQGYENIAKRSGTKSEQLGVVAEEIVMGVLESIAIDRPDLELSIAQGNAFQDVEEKIDFIISTKNKKRGVGVESANLQDGEKHIGIQFTTNLSAKNHKQDQINKSKGRGTHMDDILYVAIDIKILARAIADWTHTGKSIKGPWAHLPAEVRKTAIAELFKSVLSEEHVSELVNAA